MELVQLRRRGGERRLRAEEDVAHLDVGDGLGHRRLGGVVGRDGGDRGLLGGGAFGSRVGL